MGKLIKCKSCGNEIASIAKICPSCGAKNKKPVYKKWWFWTLIIIFVIIVGSAGGNQSSNNDTNSAVEEQVVTEEKNKPTISKAEFDALQTGMTYNEVVEIIGGEGEMSSQVDIAGYKTEMYMWKGEGSLGANANVTFQNNSLTSKAQFGLE